METVKKAPAKRGRKQDNSGPPNVSACIWMEWRGQGVDVEGRDELAAAVEEHVTAMDAHFELRDVVEVGPFVIQYVGVTATIDGQRVASDDDAF